MDDFERLNIRMAVRDEQLKRAIKQNTAAINKFARDGGRGLSGLSRRFDVLGRAARSIGPLLAGAFSVAAVKNVTGMAKELQNLSTLSGVGVEDFQRLAIGAETVGVSSEKLADIYKDVNDKLGDFAQTGAGPLVDFFEQIGPAVGVSLEAFQGLSSDQALQLYVDSLEAANVSQAEMTFYMEAIASDATALVPLLRDGGFAFKHMAEQGEAFSTVMGEDVVDQMAAMDDFFSSVLGNMSRNFGSFIAYVVTGFDDMFGLTLYGQTNKLRREASEIEASMIAVQSAIDAAGGLGSDTLAIDEFSGVLGVDAVDVEGARKQLEGYASDLEIVNAELDEIQIVYDKLNKVRDTANANPPGFSGAGGAGGSGGKATKEALDYAGALSQIIALTGDASLASADFARILEAAQLLYDAGSISAKKYAEYTKLIENQHREVLQTAGRLETEFENMFASIVTGANSASDAIGNLLVQLGNMLISAAFSGLFGGVADALAPIFTPAARAVGGPAAAGVPYLVNEQTPNSEIFVPSQSGAVLNVSQAQAALSGYAGASRSSGSAGVSVNFAPVIDARGADRAALEALRQDFQAMAANFGHLVVSATNEAKKRGRL